MEAHVDPATKELIARAAHFTDQSVPAFVVRAARSAAAEVVGRADTTLLSADQFDALLDSMDEPDPAPGLAALSRRSHRYTI